VRREVKKLFAIFAVSILFCGTVNAETYYENDNGVKLTEEEYNFIAELYNEYYPSVITIEEYNRLVENDIFGHEIIHVSEEPVCDVSNTSSTYGTLALNYEFYETNYKKLVVSYSCGSSTCEIAASLCWKIKPTVRSYDLFGTIGVNTSSISEVYSRMFVNGDGNSAVEFNKTSKAVAATHKLPTTSFDELYLILSFAAEKKGTFTVSYQHARKSISLANSRKYTFNTGGYGMVFLFESGIGSYYDQMDGLTLVFS
jgi:hypothetical protein